VFPARDGGLRSIPTGDGSRAASRASSTFNQGVAVKTGDLTWDGTSISGSTCGNHVSCYQPGFAPAGHYVARMCATPGNLTTAHGGFP
jgi:hypothetical protein